MKSDSNPLHSDSNLGIWKCEEHMKDLNPCKMDSNPIYRMKLKVEYQVEGFESSNYGFESFIGT